MRTLPIGRPRPIGLGSSDIFNFLLDFFFSLAPPGWRSEPTRMDGRFAVLGMGDAFGSGVGSSDQGIDGVLDRGP
jgi:hypothetical protein